MNKSHLVCIRHQYDTQGSYSLLESSLVAMVYVEQSIEDWRWSLVSYNNEILMKQLL